MNERQTWTRLTLLFLAGAALVAGAGTLTAAPAPAGAPTDEESAVRNHVRALEESFRGDPDALVRRFEESHFSRAYREGTRPADRRALLLAIRDAAAEAGDVMIDVREGRFFVTLAGPRSHEIAFSVEANAPWGIVSLALRELDPPADTLELTREDLPAAFERLEKEGFSGVVHVRLGGELVLERPFGMANAELGVPVSLDTVFGTGSRPIDYTKAAIYLLEQEGKLGLDDTIDKHFPQVPADKRAITIRHLMTGRSGLVDFFDTPGDWDPDLAWIDRATAERRLLSSELLFEPGSDRRHSHGAFGLLAALVERVSGQRYADFLEARFFEPAGMTRTGSYGETKGLALADFAVGGGPSLVGLPNIPPNWGPTSWLVMGSGGMFSSLPDLRRFYAFVRSDALFEKRYADVFRQAFVSADGSDRGFELFHVHLGAEDEAYLVLNMGGAQPGVRELTSALERLVQREGEPR